MTIDEMLDKVAENLNTPPVPQQKPAVKAEAVREDKPVPVKTVHNPKDKMSLSMAKEIAYLVEKAAEAMNVKVVTAVDNDGANLVLLQAMDDSYIASITASQEKAYTAVALKMPTHVALKESRGGSLDGYTNGNGILMLGGGYPLEYGGKIYGGVGVSGGTKEQDTILAKAAADYFRARMNTKI